MKSKNTPAPVSARRRYLVCYDVTDARRLRETHKKMLGFGDPIQYSVFVCDLSAKERVLLEQALTVVINLKEDRVLFADMGRLAGRRSENLAVLGTGRLPEQRSAVVY